MFFEPIFSNFCSPNATFGPLCAKYNIYIYIYIHINTYIYIYVYIHIYRKNSRSRSMDTCVKSPICPMKLFVALLRFHARVVPVFVFSESGAPCAGAMSRSQAAAAKGP